MSWAPLRTSLLAGAAYDLAVGLSIVAALRPLSTVLPIPYPAEPIYARLCGVLLAGLGALYGATALALPHSALAARVAMLIRLGGGAFLVAAPLVDAGVPPFLAVFGAVDLAFAVWLAIALRIAARRRG